VPVAERRGLRLWPRGALRFVAPSSYALVRLALRALGRLALIASPCLAIAGIVYAALLARHDLYFLTTEKPPEYWIATLLIGPAAAVTAWFILRRLLMWSLAIPILLFEGTSARRALGESEARTRSRIAELALWHAAWLAAGSLFSTGTTALVGAVGRVLIRPDSALSVIAAMTGLVGAVSLVLYLATLVLSATVYVALVERLYSLASAERIGREQEQRLAALDGLRWKPARARVGTLVTAGATVALIVLGLGLVNRARIAPTAEVTAHRGAKHEAPENTIPAIERAITLGADWVEIDVQLTSDHQVIVAHDRDFVRVAGSPRRAEESDLAEIRELDVGAWFAAEFEGVRAPTLDEVLETARGRVRVNIELKYYTPDRGLAAAVIEAVERHDMADEVTLMSFEHERIAEARVLRPDWRMGVLVAVALGNALRLDADFYAVPPSLASRGFIRAARRRGREVHVWTVEDPVRISAMMSRGADNLYTGETAVVRRVIAERAALGPVERLLIDIAADLGVVRVPPGQPSDPGDS
jgi:glycerophosphoryl diester phosphodiesterase